MSTILDSLKKSSDKRDGSEKSSIDNFNFGKSNKSPKSGIILILILIIITAVILAYGYKYLNNQVDKPQNKTELVNVDQNVNKQPVKVNTATENKTKVSQQPRKIQKPNSEMVKKQLTETKAKQTQLENPVKKVTKKDDSKLTIANNPNTKVKKIEQKSNSKSLNPVRPITNNQPNKSVSEKPMNTVKVVNEANDRQKNKVKPVVKKQEHMYVYQLPFSVRKEIPKFKLNIHIFDEDPNSRVAVINGTKFEVGDLIEEQVLIKEIVREGVLLEFNNHVFLVPNL